MKLNKKQKRTATIASMAALLAVVLGMGGQTFAKYISTKTVSDTATVAKWGYVVNANASNLGFSKFYKDVALSENDATATVASSGDANVVAPGTTGSVRVTVTGEAEVDAKILFAASGTNISVKSTKGADSTYYYPIKWTLTKNSNPLNTPSNDKDSLADVITALNDASEEVREANSPRVNDVYEISWAWAYEGQNDTLDTYLGWYTQGVLGDEGTGVTKDGDSYYTTADDGKTTYEFVKDVKFNFSVTITQEN